MQHSIVPVTHFQQNCSVVWCQETKEGAVIDPGGEVEKILACAQQHDLRITKVLLTHGHMDHVGGTAELIKTIPVPVEGPHINDNFWIQALDTQAEMMGFSKVEPFTPQRWLEDGDTVSFGKVSLSVSHCPGHTPGHIVFHNTEEHIAFVGDVLFKGSIGRTDFPQGDYDSLVASIRNKLWPMGDDTLFIPGHGPVSTFGHERQNNPFIADARYG